MEEHKPSRGGVPLHLSARKATCSRLQSTPVCR
jgi:hypothetical protein